MEAEPIQNIENEIIAQEANRLSEKRAMLTFISNATL